MTARPRAQRLLQDSLLASAERDGARTAVIVEGEPHAYAEVLELSRRFAGAAGHAGVRRGDRVVVHAGNSLRCVASFFGTLLAGGVPVVVNPQTKAEKLGFIVDDCGAVLLVTDTRPDRALPAGAARPSLRAVIACGPAGRGTALDFDAVVGAAEPRAEPPPTIPTDLAALIYTSGSTGTPKGVMMTHQSMVFTAESIAEYLRLSSDDRILGVLPLGFDYGLYQLLMACRLGATLVLERSFAYPARVLQRVEEQEVTVFPGVPTIFATLLGLERERPLAFPSVRRVSNTAAALPPAFLPGLRRLFPNALLYSMYGLTECKRVSYLEPELLDERPLSVGKAIPGTEVFVADAAGRQVPPGEIGVLHVRGPHVMAGYWHQPDLSAEMLRDGSHPGDRVLCTQDFFRMDEDGFLYFVGRSDDIIKTKGQKASPLEVENALHAIGGVREAAVAGVPDATAGEAIRAFVVLDPGAELTEQDIRRGCRLRLEDFMVPSEVVFVTELPKTETGKVRRASLDHEPV